MFLSIHVILQYVIYMIYVIYSTTTSSTLATNRGTIVFKYVPIFCTVVLYIADRYITAVIFKTSIFRYCCIIQNALKTSFSTMRSGMPTSRSKQPKQRRFVPPTMSLHQSVGNDLPPRPHSFLAASKLGSFA